jgi:hypothetical protein
MINEQRALKRQLRAKARHLHGTGLSHVEIGKIMGVPPRRISEWLSPVTTDRDLSQADGHYRDRMHIIERVSSEDFAARLAEIPKFDNRSLIGQIVGDPLPGRSALDRKMAAQRSTQ